MIIFSLFLIGVILFFGVGYFLCSVLASPIKYNSWVKVRTGFYSDFVGQVIDYGFFKYSMKLYGKESNNSLFDKLNRKHSFWWFNLQIIDKPAELVKEDFCNKIEERWGDKSLEPISAVSLAVSTLTSTINTSSTDYTLSIEKEEDNYNYSSVADDED